MQYSYTFFRLRPNSKRWVDSIQFSTSDFLTVSPSTKRSGTIPKCPRSCGRILSKSWFRIEKKNFGSHLLKSTSCREFRISQNLTIWKSFRPRGRWKVAGHGCLTLFRWRTGKSLFILRMNSILKNRILMEKIIARFYDYKLTFKIIFIFHILLRLI